MESAFGIDHGDISKAASSYGTGSKAAKVLLFNGTKMRQAASASKGKGLQFMGRNSSDYGSSNPRHFGTKVLRTIDRKVWGGSPNGIDIDPRRDGDVVHAMGQAVKPYLKQRAGKTGSDISTDVNGVDHRTPHEAHRVLDEDPYRVQYRGKQKKTWN